MNGSNYDFNRVVIETPYEREQKKRGVRKLFSRVFLALFLYIAVSQFSSAAIYVAASALLSPEQYTVFAESTLWQVTVSCAVQYLVAFPIFILTLTGTKKAQKQEKAKLSLKDFILLFLVGEALMYVGNIIGTFLNELFGAFTGNVPENSIEAIVSETPMWLIFLLMVVIGPIVEELICRKLLIDRLSIYGDHIAIIFSSVAFGLLHANLYQFFYAALLGAVLGYVYTRTRDVKYGIYIHMIINFMGSIVALPVEKAMTEFYELYELAMLGEQINILALLSSGTVTLIYTNLQYGMIVGGIFALVHLWRNKKIKVNTDKEIYLPDGEVVKNGVVNPGAILFLILSFTLMLLNIILA